MKSLARGRSAVARPQAHYRTDSGGISIELVIYAAGIALFAAAVIGGALIVFGRVQNSNAQQALEEAVNQAEQHYTRLTPSGRLNFAGSDSPNMQKLIRLYNDPVNRGDLRWFGIDRAEIGDWNNHPEHRGLWALAVQGNNRVSITGDSAVEWPDGEESLSESDVWVQANLASSRTHDCVPRAVSNGGNTHIVLSRPGGTGTNCAILRAAGGNIDADDWATAWQANGGLLGYSSTAGVLPWEGTPPDNNDLGNDEIGLSAPGQVIRMGLRSQSGDTYCAIIVRQSSNTRFVGKSYHALPAEVAVQAFRAGDGAAAPSGIASCGMTGNASQGDLDPAPDGQPDGLNAGLLARAFYSPATATRVNKDLPTAAAGAVSLNLTAIRGGSGRQSAAQRDCQGGANFIHNGKTFTCPYSRGSATVADADVQETTLLSPVPLDP